MAYETGPFGIGLANAPNAGGGGGMGSLASLLASRKQNDMGGGAIGAIGNIAMGAATTNPIQIAAGLLGGLNEILAGNKRRKEERMAKLQAMSNRSGAGW